MTKETRKKYTFNFKGYQPKFVRDGDEYFMDYEMTYFSETHEFTESELEDYLKKVTSNDTNKKYLDHESG